MQGITGIGQFNAAPLELEMILHIPHSSRLIPHYLRDQIVLSDEDLYAELLIMTDAYTDELFTLPMTTTVRFPISRLLVDVERFPDDTMEPMSKSGMGMIYTRTSCGRQLKRTLEPHETRNLVSQYYEPHHQALFAEVRAELEKHGKALIIDCHSFPNRPLPCDEDQSIPRPDFCIGTDPFHTPGVLTQVATGNLMQMGYSVEINRPYSGSLVPMAFYGKDRRVASIMVEVNRILYMDELTGTKTSAFDDTKGRLQTLLNSIREFQQVA